MTEAEKVRALVGYRIEQAEEALRSADVNLDQGLLRSAVNRAYYAMFYAVLALLVTRTAETSKHTGVLSLFDRHFVKPGTFSRDFSRWLHEAFSQRQDADYAIGSDLAVADVEELRTHARDFVAAVRDVLARDGYLPDQT